MMLVSPYQFWIDLGSAIISPKRLVFGVIETVVSWGYTRNWLLLIAALPALLIGGYMVVSDIVLQWQGSDTLLQRYWELIESENKQLALLNAQANDSGPESSTEMEPSTVKVEPTGNLSQFANSLLLKVLQLENSDQRANYLVASALGSQGRRAQARQIMRRIAPEGERGFAPAHAWLALDRLQVLGAKDKRELEVLMYDLSLASKWPFVEPRLMSAYADLLARDKQIDQAIDVLRDAGKRDSRLLVKLADLAKQQGREPLFNSLNSELSTARDERVQSGKATELDFVELISLKILNKEIEGAVQLTQAGLKEYPTSDTLRRLLSNAFMLAFEEATSNKVEGRHRMEILDAAMKADPTNPAVVEKIAALTAEGKVEDERIAGFLREQLAAGKATALTHLLLSIGHLRKQDLEKAIVHLEIAYGLAPNNPIILNNLALCIARTRPKELAKARMLIETALKIAGNDAERLDTYGEILMLSEDYVTAIRAFETALSLNQDRSDTRQKLADAYTKVALDDMATAVKDKLQKDANQNLLKDDGIIKPEDIIKDQPK